MKMTTALSIGTELITTADGICIQNCKGGENEVASEWEELERLSKEELIIELVKERTMHREMDRAIRGILDVDYPTDRRLPVFVDEEDVSAKTTSMDWACRVTLYAYEHSADRDSFNPFDAEDYGLTRDQSAEAYRILRSKGIITNPDYDLQGW